MYAFLLPLGVLCALAGLISIGFGVPVKEFALGNTLILAGTIGFTGGIAIIGLAAAVRQLGRVVNALAGRASARGSRPADLGDVPVGLGVPAPAGTRVQFPSRPNAEPHPYEPRAAQVPFPAASGDGDVRLRQRNARANDGTEFHQQMPDVAPTPPAVAMPPAAAPAAASAPPTLRAQPDGGGQEPARGMPRDDAAPGRSPEPTHRANPFDTVWPAGGRAVRGGAEAPAREATPVVEPSPSFAHAPPPGDLRRTPEPARPAPSVAPEFRETPPPVRSPAEPRSVSILKSGVIDGMAYTLYTDGSIEAQLPQGTMRFASIDELRIYLETHN